MQAVKKRVNEEGLGCKVLPVTWEDLGELVTSTIEHWDEFPEFGSHPVDPAKLAGFFTEMMANPHKLLLAAKVEGVGIGVIGAYIGTQWYSERTYSKNVFLYVVPRWRGSNIASTLLTIYKQWALARQVDDIYFETGSGVKPKSLRKFIEFHGFRKCGDILILEK